MAYLAHLTVDNFRNLAPLDLELPAGVLVFFGANAQGKTALLEAVYTLAIARSFRAESEWEVVNFHAAKRGDMAVVGGSVDTQGSRLQVNVGYQPAAGRSIASLPGRSTNGEFAHAGPLTPSQPKEDGRKAARSIRKHIRVSRVRRTAAELVGMVHAVLFSADDIRLVAGPPSVRRRFLDILLSQADPLYVKALQRYYKVLKQRNQLLRLLRDGRAGSQELEFWTEQLVADGSWLTWRRSQAVDRLGPLCQRKHEDLSGPGGDLGLLYQPNVPLTRTGAEMEGSFRAALASRQGREKATAATAAGPHRDDLAIMLDGVDMGSFASRGQARTLALALKMAEAAHLAEFRDEGPIVLLDDVLSEMDSNRRRRVLEQAAQYQQALITTTDVELASDYFGSRASYFKVEAGQVRPCSPAMLSAAVESGA